MVIVTGAAGFIGSAFIWKLNKEGRRDVIASDRFRDGDKWLNLRGCHYEDFLYPDMLEDYVKSNSLDIEAIIHMGACSTTTEKNMDYLYNTNYLYSKKMYKLATTLKAKFIYASSAATYGDFHNNDFNDHIASGSLRPLNKYGYSKNMFDVWVSRQDHSIDVIGMKFFNVFGPNEYHKGSMASVLFHNYNQYCKTQRCRLFKSENKEYNDGEQQRDFVYIKDVVSIIYLFLTKRIENGIYNVGTGRAETFYDFMVPLFRVFNDPVNIDFIDMPDHLRGKYQYYTQANMAKTFSALNIDSSFFSSLDESVFDYVKNYLMKETYLDYND